MIFIGILLICISAISLGILVTLHNVPSTLLNMFLVILVLICGFFSGVCAVEANYDGKISVSKSYLIKSNLAHYSTTNGTFIIDVNLIK